ncbi:hypothetical protein [Salinarimonas chemoclinalis]|uniref:hypothetical protein n=1 Tax=Salinarimonas chemoclinalis TaxID=3241599 RepID=UPI003558BB02
MDPTQLQPADLGGIAQTAGPLAGAIPQAGAFQAVYRETLEAPPARRGVDLANDVRATAEGFMNLERTLNTERVRMFQALVPDLALDSRPGVAVDGRGREMQVVRAGGAAALPGGDRVGGGGDGAVAYGGALARDSDRVSLGVRPLYSDAPASVPKGLMSPLVQNALGLPEGTGNGEIDFARQLERLDNASMGLMERMAQSQRSLPADATLSDNMRQFGELSAISQEFSRVTTSKAVVAQLYVGVYEEVKNKALTAVNLIQSAFNKLNQVFNQLKSGS